MASLTNVLAGIPGYAGYIAAQQAGQEREMGALRQVSTLAQIQAQLEAKQKEASAQQRDVALREAIAALPPEKRTREHVLPLLLEHGNITAAANLLPAAAKPEGPQQIGSGGLRMPDGTIIPPAARPGSAEVKPPATRQRYDGTNVVQEEYIDGQWRQIGRGPRFQPEKPTRLPTPKQGYRWNAEGTEQERIPGGPVDQKFKIDQAGAKRGVDLSVQSIDRLVQAMGELEAHEGLPRITGPVAGRAPNLFEDATNAQAKLDSIKSQLFVTALQAMREASRTGGAVGNVTEKEGDKLENTIAALAQAQGTDQFKVELKKAQEQLKTSKAIIQRAYDEQYGGGNAVAVPPPNTGPAKVTNDAEYNVLPSGTIFMGPDGKRRRKP